MTTARTPRGGAGAGQGHPASVPPGSESSAGEREGLAAGRGWCAVGPRPPEGMDRGWGPGGEGDAAGGADPSGLRYEELVAALEATVERLAGGDVGIEEATALYERASRLHALAAERLAQVRERAERTVGPAG